MKNTRIITYFTDYKNSNKWFFKIWYVRFPHISIPHQIRISTPCWKKNVINWTGIFLYIKFVLDGAQCKWGGRGARFRPGEAVRFSLTYCLSRQFLWFYRSCRRLLLAVNVTTSKLSIVGKKILLRPSQGRMHARSNYTIIYYLQNHFFVYFDLIKTKNINLIEM